MLDIPSIPVVVPSDMKLPWTWNLPIVKQQTANDQNIVTSDIIKFDQTWAWQRTGIGTGGLGCNMGTQNLIQKENTISVIHTRRMEISYMRYFHPLIHPGAA